MLVMVILIMLIQDILIILLGISVMEFGVGIKIIAIQTLGIKVKTEFGKGIRTILGRTGDKDIVLIVQILY